MKKSIKLVVVSALLATSLFSATRDGTVSKLSFLSDGRVFVTLDVSGTPSGAFITDSATGDTKKTFIAAVMTAKSTGDTVRGYLNSGFWTSFELK